MIAAPTSRQPPQPLLLRPQLAELDRLARWIEDFVHCAGLSPETVFALNLCAEEAVANIIMYGGVEPDGEAIVVALDYDAREVVVQIEDRGRQFDPTLVPPRLPPASLDEAVIGKLGIHLIRNFASAMSYELRDGINRLTLRFARAEAPSRPEA